MYENKAMLGGAQYANQVICASDPNPTVGENLQSRIEHLKAELARLEASKETLGPLMNMRIRDIRDAMNY